MADTLRVVFLIAVSSNLVWCCLNYYDLLLNDGKRKRNPRQKTIAIYLLGIVCGVLIVLTTYTINMGNIPLVITALLLCGSLVITKAGWVSRLIVIFATLINVSGAYAVVYSFAHLFIEEESMASNVINVQHITAWVTSICAVWAGILMRSKRFPNGTLSEVIRIKGTRGYMLGYMIVFSVVESAFVMFFIGTVFSAQFEGMDRIMVAIANAMYGFFVSMCAYLIVFYICKTYEERQKSLLLEGNLKREMDFRHNIYSGAFMVFCANLTENIIEEGQEAFTGKVKKAEDRYIFTDTMKIFMDNCLHPDDYNKVKPFADIKKMSGLFKVKSTYTTQARISVGETRKYFSTPTATVMSDTYSESQWPWFEIRFTNTRDEDKGTEYLYVTFYNVDKKVNAERALKHEAATDALTGLLNRREFEQRVKQCLSLEKNRGVLYYIDMDTFKDINDRYGHPEGDRVLIRASDVLRDLFRAQDIIGRIGGDEFAVFVRGKTDESTITRMASQINDEIRAAYNTKDGVEIRSSVSVGIAVAPLHGKTFQELYENADKALYDAKGDGKDRHVIYSA